jgi:hypothetical protein
MNRCLTIALLYVLSTTGASLAAPAVDDILQQATNYVFTGKVDPVDAPEIVDPKTCVVVVQDPKFKRFARYYLSRFKMNESMITKKYYGSQTLYELDVEGDAVILEYLAPDRTTVLTAFKSAQILLPGEIERTRKALSFIFSSGCKAEEDSVPF